MLSETHQHSRSLLRISLKKSDYFIFGSLLLLCIVLRLWFWYATNLTFEDALITFRYAENIASGNGFVYNMDEQVLGTTTPAWTLLLAGVKYSSIDIFIGSKILGILMDAITLCLIISILYPISVRIAIFCALLFIASPVIIPASISGMETSLLLCMMSVLLLGYVRKNALFGIGLALTVLTRIDGVLYAFVFALAAILQDRRWTLRQIIFACVCCAPWYIFSIAYFGNILPQSLLAKHSVYNLSLFASSASFIHWFTPFLETQLLKFLVKSGVLILIAIGIVLLFKNKSILFPLNIFIFLYCALFITSGAVIFSWYLVPPIFISYFITAVALDWCMDKTMKYLSKPILQKAIFSTFIVSILLGNIILFLSGISKYRELQRFEAELRRPIGLWLKQNAKPGSKIFLEPIGYIGYFAGLQLIVWDEIGLVNPKVVEHRKNESDWYTKSIKTLNPDYIVQYAMAFEKNKAEGTLTQLFKDDADRAWFSSHFNAILTMEASNSYPTIEQKEKKYIIFKRVNATL